MSSPRAKAVVSGDARFEVLSPTLIRTEYAGDTQFLDAPTYNAIGRDGFSGAPFTTSTSNGWLSIDTGTVVLRYKTGSGPFGPDNLQLRLKAGRQQVTAAPWGAHSCDFGKLCEAESLQLNGVGVATDHTGYTGTGFAAGFQSSGSSISFQVTAPTAGTYELDARYANAVGGDGQDVTRTLTVSANGTDHGLTLPTTADWNTWGLAKTQVTLAAGTNTVTVHRSASDSGNVNIDSLAVLTPGAAYPPAPSNVRPCPFGTVCEAEAGTLNGSAVLAGDHSDYSGGGFVAGLESAGASDVLHVTGVPKAGHYALQLRYSNAQSAARKITVQVGSEAATTASLDTTSSWDSWRTVAVPVDLAAGDQDVTLGCTADADSCHLNLDTAALTAANAPLLAPHAPLGGYRRGLDGVNGSAPTTPGLLYQDGWSLLDDSGSAVFDDATKQVTQRGDHHGKPYQDGYLFAYGHDYQRALSELATLTGPSELLPRWAYGVWYSEYYDRSAADYENTILPKFRADGVPLDVLVTDTDFKSPSTWDGWEMDPAKYPDPKAFFDWAASMGLHNTLNIHPSIVPNDSQYAQAQATAGNTLTKDGSQYVFDWGQPAQLKAYMDLHQSMEQAGADFWWLDWCCDNSYSSLGGVTPDAWINQQYASDANKTVGRGFVLSRAFGSLQAGGYSGPQPVAGGPWADKRTTVHFTGDTTSTWATLKFEVGYTPGESASTGLSAVSHDIGGFNNDGTQAKGAEPGSTKDADDLYARWVQLGTFQPIDRLHGNHSDRLPWQYGTAAKDSAEKFLNLRENLVPYTYTLAQQASRTGVPVTRPLYLQYPDSQEAYAQDGAEYLYGPDMLVAPVTTPGESATTSVWFPPGSSWTDYFTGKTYAGGTTAQITTDLSTMPVFVKSGGIVTTRTHDVANDVQSKLTAVTATVAEGASGSSSLYEDDGVSKSPAQVRQTRLDYSRTGAVHTLRIAAATGPVTQRQWTVAFTDATAPSVVSLNGRPLPSSAWSWDAAGHTLTVTTPTRPTDQSQTVSYR
ncbi:TIM-barrel domain-containing protein [Phaeacidiphilus oryzae]|uniref:TIM-barrel domain-containing protein n=1 Tax=Phaeacidiphilus oryzae TaxID=348818 RepID=UPI0009FEBCCD|nr:TIM-barrel domain-containing protein [Phaeacidiphilus oryzae]